MPSLRRLLPVLGALAVTSAVPVAAGCGAAGGNPDADPAALVPERAAVYVEGNLAVDDDVRALSRKLLGEDDPAAAITRAASDAARRNGRRGFDYAKDIDPWLGNRAAVFLTRAGGSTPDVALVVAADDVDAGLKFLDDRLREAGRGEGRPQVTQRTYHDVEYSVDTRSPGGDAVAAVDDYLVTGTEAGLKAAIDARDGAKLSSTPQFTRARADASGDQGFAYVRTTQLLSGLGPQGAVARQALGGSGDTLAFGLDAAQNAASVKTVAYGVRSAAAEAGPGKVLAGLPATAWLAAGTASVGKRFEQALQQFGQLGAFGGFDLESALRQVRRQTGLDVRRDLLAWMGDAGVFVRGTSASDVGGAVIVETTDPATTRRAIPKLARLLRAQGGLRVRPLSRAGVDAGVTLRSPQVPLPIHVALAGKRFIVAVTDAALGEALRPGRPLSASPAFQQATRSLGQGLQPGLFVDFGPLRSLIDSTGRANDPSAAKARRALEQLTTFVAGSRREGTTQRGRAVLGVK